MTKSRYDVIADWYDNLVSSGNLIGDIVLSSLFDLLGNVEGQEICDLACGQGRITRELANRDAKVVGVDISADLIAIAQSKGVSNNVKYLVDDAETLSKIEDNRFDVVVCNLALMDIADIDKTVNTVWRILRDGGYFVFSITHPCFEAPHAQWITAPDGTISREITTYFKEEFWRSNNPEGVRGKVGAHHRMLSTYLNALTRVGFMIAQILEPKPTDDKTNKEYQIIPAFMLVKCVKRLSL